MPHFPEQAIIRRLFTMGQPLALQKGEILIGNDPEPNGVYFVTSGYLKAYSISNDGDEYIHVVFGPGDIFPLVWAYLETHHQFVYYETISDSVVWRLSRDWFRHFIRTRIDISYAMSLLLAQEFKVFVERIDNLEYKKASERVAYRVLLLASRFGVKNGDGIVIDAPITHEILANTVNLARESVSREFERLEQEQVIERDGHRILIKNVAALARKLSRPIDFTRLGLIVMACAVAICLLFLGKNTHATGAYCTGSISASPRTRNIAAYSSSPSASRILSTSSTVFKM